MSTRHPATFDSVEDKMAAFLLNPEGDEVTVVNFGFDEVTVDGHEAAEEVPIDVDEPTLEYPRMRSAHRTSSRPEWYVRLRIREDRIAKLWVRRLASPDVLVWWDKRQTWVPLLSVPRMRRTVSVMQEREKERSKGRTDSSLPPPMPVPNPVHEVELRRSSWVESWRQRVMAESRMTPAVRTLISGAFREPVPSVALRSRESGPPPSSLPPVVVDVESPTIPSAPRVPDVVVPGSLVPDPSIQSLPAKDRLLREQPPSARMSGLGYKERVIWLAAAVVLAGLVVVSRFVVPPAQRGTGLVDRVSRVAAKAMPTASAPSPAPAASCGTAESRSPSESIETASASAPSNGSTAHGTRPAQASARPVPSFRPSPSSPVAPNRSSGSSTVGKSSAPVVAPVTRAVTKPLANDLGGFDPAAARRALISAGLRAGYCGEGPVSGSVVVTFAPTGFVQSASLASLNGDNVAVDCVLRAFKAARITPYDGRAITVSKSFRGR